MELCEPIDSQRDRQWRIRRINLLSVILQGWRRKLSVRHRRDLRSQYIDLGLAKERPWHQSDGNEGTRQTRNNHARNDRNNAIKNSCVTHTYIYIYLSIISRIIRFAYILAGSRPFNGQWLPIAVLCRHGSLRRMASVGTKSDRLLRKRTRVVLVLGQWWYVVQTYGRLRE